ncbi:hypothetical protein AB0M22_45225 [Nocardia sp. NPDC051756]|uniref:hypothetical protein n=1 Tax=Nocardia sp. NPDC051756 TaxID=3154751 RepID=UPI00344527A3
MSNIALYTFGVLDPAMEPTALSDLSKRGDEILSAVDDVPGFVGRAGGDYEKYADHAPGEDFGRWGSTYCHWAFRTSRVTTRLRTSRH